MYVTLTRVKTSGQSLGDATILAEEMERWLRDIDGFEGLLLLSREGTTLGLSFWESRDIAEAHRPVRMEFLQRMTSIVGVEIEEIVDYDVSFARLGRLTGDSS